LAIGRQQTTRVNGLFRRCGSAQRLGSARVAVEGE
jgi:hypothetical protein